MTAISTIWSSVRGLPYDADVRGSIRLPTSFHSGSSAVMSGSCDRIPGSAIRVVAHRGASADAPENTLAAFRLGFDRGADAIEGDFRLTRDGVVVAMHDETLLRTAGDRREVAAIDAETLATLPVGEWGPWRGRGFDRERAPSLADVLALVPESRGIFVELKGGPDLVAPALATIEASPLPSKRIVVISFDAAVVEAFKRLAPGRPALWLASFRLRDGRWSPSVEEVVATARRIGADGVDVEAESRVVDETFVAEVRAAGLELHVWTVNDPTLAGRMASLGVDSITTDRPAALRTVLVDPASGGDRD